VKDKLLIWLGDALYRFGLAEALQKNCECDLIAIVDVDIKQKTFFEKQNLVKFKKIWYYRDHVDLSTKGKFDLNYLQTFEKKYGINLWNIAYSERYFYKFNIHEFTHDEILSILEQECKLFENAIEETKPDFLIIGTTDLHHNYLLSEICKALGINVLMLAGARFGYKEMICEEADRVDDTLGPIQYGITKNGKTIKELQTFLKKFDNVKQIKEFEKNLQVPITEKIRKFFQLIFIYGGKDFRNQFEHVGMTRTKILKEKLMEKFKKKSVLSFVNGNLPKVFDKEIPFVYYPLNTEPERALSIAAPFYTNQIELITHIAKSLPIGYRLYVKDHPGMNFKGGRGRSISFYKEIMELPNVKLLHPSINPEEILKNCSLVITINGTTGLEAAFYNKPTITFVQTLYTSLPSVYTLKNINELPQTIRTALQTKVNVKNLNDFVNFIEKNSFKLDRKLLVSDFRNRFLYKNIKESEMKSYLDTHKSTFDKMAHEHLKKIKQIREIKNNIHKKS